MRLSPILFSAFVSFVVFPGFVTQTAVSGQQSDTVTIKVDSNTRVGPMKPIWAWFGYDEPNYTYMKDGQRLLTDISKLSPVPVFVRTHNLLTTGRSSTALSTRT